MKIAADGISLTFDPSLGLIERFEVGGAAPLHTAPWVGHEEMPEGADPHLARLGGDFFCAPFAGREGQSPSHGWPANSAWKTKSNGSSLTATLQKTVFGATLTKTLALRNRHPFVYQRHVFDGGEGEVAVANHACVSLPKGGIVRTSPKRWWETPGKALEPDPARGRSALVYPARGQATAFPETSGTCDLTRFPWGSAHEDFVAGVEAPGHALGWTAVTRLGKGDVFLSLRNATHLPMTMLWHSHGGRDYAPWSGRHRNCLGVEEGAARHMLGLSNDVDLTAPGAVSLGDSTEVCHAIGAVPWPCESAVEEVSLTSGALKIRGDDGARITVPFDAGWLGL